MSGVGFQYGWLRSSSYFRADVCLLVVGAGAWWVLGLVPAHQWSEMGPRVSDFRVLKSLSLVSAHWYVRLVLGPLVDKAMSRGSCVLKEP